MIRQTGTIAGLVRGLLCSAVWLGLAAVATAVPTTYTRGTTAGNWDTTTLWSPVGYPGSDAADTGVFSTVTGQFAEGGQVSAMYDGKAYAFSVTYSGSSVVLTLLPRGTFIMVK